MNFADEISTFERQELLKNVAIQVVLLRRLCTKSNAMYNSLLPEKPVNSNKRKLTSPIAGFYILAKVIILFILFTKQ